MIGKSLGSPSRLQQQRKEQEERLLGEFAAYQHDAGYAQRTASYFAAQKWMLWTSKVQNLAGA